MDITSYSQTDLSNRTKIHPLQPVSLLFDKLHSENLSFSVSILLEKSLVSTKLKSKIVGLKKCEYVTEFVVRIHTSNVISHDIHLPIAALRVVLLGEAWVGTLGFAEVSCLFKYVGFFKTMEETLIIGSVLVPVSCIWFDESNPICSFIIVTFSCLHFALWCFCFMCRGLRG